VSITYKTGAIQQNFHSSRTSGQPIISHYGSCNFQVDRPSRENRQPRDIVLRSNFPIILSMYNVRHNDSIYSLLTCGFAMYRRSSTLILSSLVCDGVKHVLRYIFTNWGLLQWSLDTPFWGKLMYITFCLPSYCCSLCDYRHHCNMVPSIPSWAYAGKKLFLYNIKCSWMFADLTMITISLWSLIAHMKLSQLNFHILH